MSDIFPFVKNISLENYRVFRGKTDFEIKPVTILTGPNSSGKSSLIKIFKLLQNNSLFSDLSKLDFFSGHHNLGTFNNVLNWTKKSDPLKITLPLPLRYFGEDFKIELSYIEHQNNGLLKQLRIFSNKRRNFLDILYNPSFEEYTKNFKPEDINEELKNKFKNSLPVILKVTGVKYLIDTAIHQKEKYIRKEEKKTENIFTNFKFRKPDYSPPPGLSVFETYFVKEQAIDVLDEKRLKIVNADDCLLALDSDADYFKNNPEDLKEANAVIINIMKYYDRMFDLDYKNRQFDMLEDALSYPVEIPVDQGILDLSPLGDVIFGKLLANNIKQALVSLNGRLKKIYYISASRGEQFRLHQYSGSSDLSSIIVDFYHMNLPDSDEIIEFLKTQLKENLKIADDIKIISYESTVASILIIKDRREIALADLGFGYAQLIPILLKIAIIAKENREDYLNEITYNSSLFILEEPEANLHPNLQSKLADLIVAAGKMFNIQFIVETHSEYLIRKLQNLTAKKVIHPRDSVIYYFNYNDPKVPPRKKLKKIGINELGGLTDNFEKGFYDENTSLIFDLYKLNKSSEN